MSDAGFVIAGWVLTAAAVGGYWAGLVRRTRRAVESRERSGGVERPRS